MAKTKCWAVLVACVLLACVLPLFGLPLAAAQADEPRVEAIRIPVASTGGSRSLKLEALVVRPNDGIPHPLAILNHGSTSDGAARRGMSAKDLRPQATVFAKRGWVAVVLMRRGYGTSQGDWADGYGSCSKPNYVKAGLEGARDIAAAARYMHGQSYVSKGNWISVGHSAGAFATIALTSYAPAGLAAAIGFAPGRGSSAPNTVCRESRLIEAFAHFGKTSRVPLLWIAAENDHSFGPELVRRLTGAFSREGANLTFVEAAAVGDDGHALFSSPSEIPTWSPVVDRFLAANRLALRDRLIEIALPNVAARPNPTSNNRQAQ
jgi:dienelactone hydrolase